MTTRGRRAARRLLEVLDYRTFVVAGVVLMVILVGYLVFSAFQAAHDATVSADQRGRAATRRIDKLNAEIQQLQAEIAAGHDERGQLAAAVAALSEQIRQLGGRPVLMITAAPAPATIGGSVRPSSTATSQARPTPSRTSAPRPTTSGTPRPSPTPSPTCTRLLGLLC